MRAIPIGIYKFKPTNNWLVKIIKGNME